MDRILITGGTGLVGSAIKGDVHLGSKDGDLRDMSAVNSIFEKYKPTHVVHCADTLHDEDHQLFVNLVNAT